MKNIISLLNATDIVKIKDKNLLIMTAQFMCKLNKIAKVMAVWKSRENKMYV